MIRQKIGKGFAIVAGESIKSSDPNVSHFIFIEARNSFYGKTFLRRSTKVQ
jgi:hypothetical protein